MQKQKKLILLGGGMHRRRSPWIHQWIPPYLVRQTASKKIIGIPDGDTVLSVKLHGQDQL